MRIRRGCYDKFHRCPGWVGGGSKYPKPDKVVCDGGSITNIYDRKLWKWRFNRHDKCGTIVLPYVTRYFDPFWLFDEFKFKIRTWQYNWDRRQWRREQRRLIKSHRR